jgi:hypothetical protein
MGRNVRDEDEVRETPTAVVWAVAAGTVPLPFLAVYAVLFIVHGGFHPVAPPDITSTQHGELVAGLVALGLFVVAVVALVWMLSGRRRWPFVLIQTGILATAIDFVVDPTKGGRMVSVVVAIAALAALCCALAPQSWEHIGHNTPRFRLPIRPVKAPAADSAPKLEEDEPSKDPQSV